jgi:hypothetical protein
VVKRYLTYTFGPISITFIHPFLDDTSRTQAVLSPKKKGQLERGSNFPRGPRNAGIAQRVLKIEVEKGLKSILNPPLSQK